MSMSVCLSVCEHTSGTECPISTKTFAHVTCVHGSVLLWRRCDTICTSGFMDGVIFVHNWPYGACRSMPRQRVTLSRRRVHYAGCSATAASYWLRRLLGDGGLHRARCTGRRGRRLQYTIALFIYDALLFVYDLGDYVTATRANSFFGRYYDRRNRPPYM